jgi:hypothetical protein
MFEAIAAFLVVLSVGGGLVGVKVKAADVAYYRTVAASAAANGVQAAPFLQTLRELGD